MPISSLFFLSQRANASWKHAIFPSLLEMAQQDLGQHNVSASTAARQRGNGFYKIKDFEKGMSSNSSRSIPQSTN